MKRIIPILALAAAATLAGPSLNASATARAAVQGVLPVAVMDVSGGTQLSNGKWRHTFTGINSYDPDGTITSYYWKPEAGCLAAGTYSTTLTLDIPDGYYCSITLTVTDNSGSTDSESIVIVGGW